MIVEIIDSSVFSRFRLGIAKLTDQELLQISPALPIFDAGKNIKERKIFIHVS